MRVVFAGTPRFSAVALEALLDAGHDVPLVLTQPDRPAGRGMKQVASEVKQLAIARGLSLAQPHDLKSPAILETMRVTAAEAMIVVAYGLLLPQAVLDAFPLGCLNVHASLLPRWRGAAPIQRALLAGDAATGVCIMRMEAGLDTGPVYRCTGIPIAARETAGSLHDRLAAAGATALLAVLDTQVRSARPVPQATDGVTYAAKIGREDAALRWPEPAAVLDRVIRAFDPVPGAYARLGSERVKVWQATPGPVASEDGADPGRILRVTDTGVHVACGGGSVLIIGELQRAGGRRLPVRTFLQGCPLEPGDRLEDGS